MTTTTNKMEFMEALRTIIYAHGKRGGEFSTAHTRAAWHLAEDVADGLDIEYAKQLMEKIGDAISASNKEYYSRGYVAGHDDLKEIFDDEE